MRKVLWGLIGLIVVVIGVLGAILAFNAPVKPPPLASVSDPFADVNFGSFRLAVDFGAPQDYLSGLGRSAKPAALLIGGGDELFYPDRFAPLLGPVRSDLRMTIAPGVGHIGMTVTSAGIAAVRQSFLDLTASTR
jgi:hypothetical protein